jgi:hypothetical protein
MVTRRNTPGAQHGRAGDQGGQARSVPGDSGRGFNNEEKTLNEMLEPKIEAIVEHLQIMAQREFGSKLAVICVEGGNFEAYQKAIAKVKTLPIQHQRATVVWVCMEDAELLRYPAFDVEFNLRDGSQKLGVTGKPSKVAELMRLIGGVE